VLFRTPVQLHLAAEATRASAAATSMAA